MLITIIVGCSLLLQLITIYISLRLILLTGWSKAWILLSFGITTMGLRRLVIFIELLSGNSVHSPEILYEIIGLIGSAVMLGGVVFIKPIILSLKNAEKEWEDTFDSINDAITVHDKEFTVIRANKAAEKIFGLPLVDLPGKKCCQLYHGADSPPPGCPSCQLFKTGTASAIEKFEPHLNKYIEIKAFPVYDHNAEIIKVVHVVRDITNRKQMEDRLTESEEKYRSMVETTDDSLYIVDKDCRYLFMNKKHQSRLGISDDLSIGRTYGEYHTQEETQRFTEKIQKVFQSGKAHQFEHLSSRDNNYFLQTLSPVRSGDGTIVAVSTISKNVTEFKRMQEKLRMLSVTDDLTGLYNRRGFFSLAEHQLRIASRMKKGLFLFYADVDNLKQINDKFGHLEGDQLIIRTAEILKDNFRNSDIIARIGGDEFVIFPVEAEEGTPDVLYRRLQNKIDRANEERTEKYSLSLSIGRAYYDPSKPCSIEELLKRADIAMYEQKKNKQKSAFRSQG